MNASPNNVSLAYIFAWVYVSLLSLAAFLFPKLTTPFSAPIVDYYGLSECGIYVLNPSHETVN